MITSKRFQLSKTRYAAAREKDAEKHRGGKPLLTLIQNQQTYKSAHIALKDGLCYTFTCKNLISSYAYLFKTKKLILARTFEKLDMFLKQYSLSFKC
jgi:hypothetical protein